MAKYLYNNPRRHWVFDFRKKRVVESMTEFSQDNKEVAYIRRGILTKYEIGHRIEHNGDFYLGYLISLDAYKYDEAKQELLKFLERQKFDNLTILK